MTEDGKYIYIFGGEWGKIQNEPYPHHNRDTELREIRKNEKCYVERYSTVSDVWKELDIVVPPKFQETFDFHYQRGGCCVFPMHLLP